MKTNMAKGMLWLLITLMAGISITSIGCQNQGDFYSLNTTSYPMDGGTVIPGSGNFFSGTVVIIKATPAPGYQFAYWAGDISGTEASQTIVMDSNQTIIANFAKLYTLSFASYPAHGGSVQTNPAGNTFAANTTIKLTAIPAAGYLFSHWEGDTSSNDPTTQVTMSSDKAVKAFFIDAGPPSEVSGLVAIPGKQKVRLSWQEPRDPDFARVEVSYNGLNTPIEIGKGDNSLVISELTNQTEYTFTITTVDTSGNKSQGVAIRATPYFYESLDYFVVLEGHAIKYQVSDDYNNLRCFVWGVSQYQGKREEYNRDFVFTLVKEGTQGGYYRNSLIAGYFTKQWENRGLTIFALGNPVGNQAQFYMMFSLPHFFNIGDTWDWLDRKYRVENVDTQLINGIEFPDCIKVTFNNSLAENDYVRGRGYFILAKDLGIVELSFTRDDGQQVLYQYVSSEHWDEQSCLNQINAIKLH